MEENDCIVSPIQLAAIDSTEIINEVVERAAEKKQQ